MKIAILFLLAIPLLGCTKPEEERLRCLEDASKRPTNTGVELAVKVCHMRYSSASAAASTEKNWWEHAPLVKP